MRLTIKIAWLKQLVKDGKLRPDCFAEPYTWRADESYVDIAATKFTDDEIKALISFLSSSKEPKTRGVAQKASAWCKLKARPGGVPIARLEHLAAAARQYIGTSPHKWVFRELEDGVAVPYYVESVDYEPGSKERGPSKTLLRLAYATAGDKAEYTNVVFYSDDLNGRTNVVQLLNDRGYYLETEAMVADYMATLAVYKELFGATGQQFLAYGTGYVYESAYRCKWSSLERDGVPSRVVMDNCNEETSELKAVKRKVVSSAFWTKDLPTKPEDDEDEDGVIEPPLHPYVNVFNLQTHKFINVHVSFLEPYKYDSTVIDKLILPESRKQLIGMLVVSSNQIMEDIVQGKTGGIIVIAVGPPGTGKTLTAQVFSEQVKRPLYEVQCSQLGMSVSALEEELRKVLARATRWNAILLIDEADVYIHARGEDIAQNAIVGVFLRVLESYRGVLFMTSNRSTVIDDAILSRATAYIQYTYPDTEALQRIWKVLSVNYLIEFTDAEIAELASTFPGISGRRVKALLKLARLAACHRSERVTLELVRYVDQFLPPDDEIKAARTEC